MFIFKCINHISMNFHIIQLQLQIQFVLFYSRNYISFVCQMISFARQRKYFESKRITFWNDHLLTVKEYPLIQILNRNFFNSKGNRLTVNNLFLECKKNFKSVKAFKICDRNLNLQSWTFLYISSCIYKHLLILIFIEKFFCVFKTSQNYIKFCAYLFQVNTFQKISNKD